MKIIYNSIFLEHETGMHPENKSRLWAFGDLEETVIGDKEKYIGLVHPKAYQEKIREACKKGLPLNQDTIVSKGSYKAAVHAVGAAIMASESNDFALVRPPGHHAYPDPAGFCLFNNIAIAAQKLVDEGKKVMILDIDGHLGDGTMRFFYGSDRVLFWSLHQHPAYPGGGGIDDIGEGKGKGFTVNIPLPAGTGDDIYMKAIERFMPYAERFNPDVVGVSAGFDSYKGDRLLGLNISLNTYHDIGNSLRRFDRVFAVLEGGYDTNLPKCVYNFIDGVNGKEKRYSEKPTESGMFTKEYFEETAKALEKNLR